jgi:hypothetical protein
MAMVKFAMLCDVDGCKKRSPEYTPWPSCTECGSDVCPEHTAPGSEDDDGEGHYSVTCTTCKGKEE